MSQYMVSVSFDKFSGVVNFITDAADLEDAICQFYGGDLKLMGVNAQDGFMNEPTASFVGDIDDDEEDEEEEWEDEDYDGYDKCEWDYMLGSNCLLDPLDEYDV